MKNYSFFAATLTLIAGTVFADSMQDPSVKQAHAETSPAVVLSHPGTYLEVGFDALFLHPMASNLHYAAEADTLPAVSPHWKIHEISPEYHFGFDLNARGILHCCNTNLMLNWEHFHSNDSASIQVDPVNMIGPMFEIGPDATPYNSATGKVSFHFDEVNLGFGIFSKWGDRLTTNLFTGVSYGFVKETLYSNFSNPSGSTVRKITTPASFWGVGPQLGIEFSYQIVAGFLFKGKTKTSFLVGTAKNHTKYVALSPGLDPADSPNNQSTSDKNKTQVVPTFEMDLGLSYRWDFCKHYSVELAAGYQVQTYFNALQVMQIGSEVNTNPVAPDIVGVFARTFEQTVSNFSLAGPYAMLTVGF